MFQQTGEAIKLTSLKGLHKSRLSHCNLFITLSIPSVFLAQGFHTLLTKVVRFKQLACHQNQNAFLCISCYYNAGVGNLLSRFHRS